VRVPETGSKGRPAYSGLGVQKGGFATRFGHLGVSGLARKPGLGHPPNPRFGDPPRGRQTSLFGGLAALAAKPPKPVQNLKKP